MIERVEMGEGIRLEAGCGVIAGNVVRRTGAASLVSARSSNRVVANDVDDAVVGDAGDVDCDGAVAMPDLIAVLTAWGPCAGWLDCREDVDGNGRVAVPDLVEVLANFGR